METDMKLSIFLFCLLVSMVWAFNPSGTEKFAEADNLAQACGVSDCGFIDFGSHPELIGGGLVLESVEGQ